MLKKIDFFNMKEERVKKNRFFLHVLEGLKS